jgi:hypothetical protein
MFLCSNSILKQYCLIIVQLLLIILILETYSKYFDPMTGKP